MSNILLIYTVNRYRE